MALELPDYGLSEESPSSATRCAGDSSRAAPIAEVRRVMESTRVGLLARALAALRPKNWGSPGIAIAEDLGGQGFGLQELGIALGEAGRALAPIPLFASAGLAARVVAAVAGEEAGPDLERIARGEAATFAWVEADGDWDPAATTLVAAEAGDEVRLTGAKHFVLGAAAAERIYVLARESGSHCDEGLSLFRVRAHDAEVRVETRESVDRTRPVATVHFGGARAHVVGVRGAAATGVRVGLDEAAALLAAEMEGGMRKVLEVAVDYAAERHQFSRPIGSFQAIKHKCADLLIDFEAARTVADAALVALDQGDPERLPALLGRSGPAAGPAYVRMATESGQIQGGVGYTWEYDAHLYFRRALASRAFFGDESVHHDRLTRMVAKNSLEERA